MAAGRRLFGEVYSSQPPGFLVILQPTYHLLGQSLAGARLAVLLLFLGGLVAAYRVASQLAGRRAGLLAMAVLAADPICFRESVALQADSPALALALIALAVALECRTGGRRATLSALLAGGLLGLGFLVKPLAAAAGPAVVVALAAPPVAGSRRLRNLGLAVAGGLLVAVALVLPFAADLGQLWEQSVGLHFVARATGLGGVDPYTLALELPMLLLGTAGWVISARRAPGLALVAGAWAAGAIFILAVQRPIWPHHLVALMTPMALLAGGLALAAPPRRQVLVTLGTAALVAAASTGAAAWVALGQVPDATHRSAVATLRAETGPADLLVTDDQYLAALAGRDTPPELVDTSMVRVVSGELTTRRVEEIAGRSGARGFLLSSLRLRKLAGLEDWVRVRYPERQQLESDRTLYLR